MSAGALARLAVLCCALGAAGCVGESWRGIRPSPATEVAVRTPAYQVQVLDSGVTLVVYEGRALPLCSVQLAVRAGAAAAEAGVAQLTYDLLRDGTEARDGVALAEAFDAIGASPQSLTTADGGFLSVQVLPAHVEQAVALLAEMIRRPRFAPEDLEERRAQLLEELAAQAGSPALLASRALQHLIYDSGDAAAPGRHPYGAAPTPEGLRRIGRADVLRFYHRRVGPRNVALILTGLVSPADAATYARRYLGDWRAPSEDPGAPPPPPLRPRREVVIVPKPGLVQTRLAIGRAAVAAGDPAEQALRVASVLYGDRLSWELREEQGYTYGASSGLVLHRGVGYLAASTSVRADATGAALREALEQLGQLHDARPSATEVYRARASAVWGMMSLFRTIEGLGRAVGGLFLLRQELDGYTRRVRQIEAVDVDAVEEALGRFFDPELVQIVLVGDPTLIVRQVAPLRLGPLTLYSPDGRPR